MKLDRVPSRILLELGLVGAVASAEACTQVSTCLSMQGPTGTDGSGTGDTVATESATSTSGGTGQDDISTSACLSPPDPTLEDSSGSATFTTGPCLSQPEDTSATGSGSGSDGGSGSGGSESGSGSDTGAGSDTGIPAPDPPDEALRRVLDSGALPPDVAARLKHRHATRGSGR